MAIERGLAYLDQHRKTGGVIDGASIDWQRWLKPEDKARIVPADDLAERGKRVMLLGHEAEPGLAMPWTKTQGRVLMRPGKLSVWAGWSRHGKTQMLKQAMLYGISVSERVLFASMEEEVLDVWQDMAQIACTTRDPRVPDLDRFTALIRGKLWLYDQQGRVDSKRIQAVIRYCAEELKITHAVIDSLMMLAVDRDDYEAQARFVSELKATAKDTGVHVHLVAHMRKRDGKSGEESPGTIHDIAGGHEIGSIADNVFIVWKDRERKDASKPAAILKVDKQRGRVNWTGSIGLNCHDESRQFTEDVHAMRFLEEPSVRI